jgi:hypothetical protein
MELMDWLDAEAAKLGASEVPSIYNDACALMGVKEEELDQPFEHVLPEGWPDTWYDPPPLLWEVLALCTQRRPPPLLRWSYAEMLAAEKEGRLLS